MPQKQITVGGHTLFIERMDVFKANDLLNDVLAGVVPLLALAGRKTTGADIAAAAQAALDRIPAERRRDVLVRLLKTVKTEGGIALYARTEEGAEATMIPLTLKQLYEVALQVVLYNFGDFFGDALSGLSAQSASPKTP